MVAETPSTTPPELLTQIIPVAFCPLATVTVEATGDE
jgi:hypothetical protein